MRRPAPHLAFWLLTLLMCGCGDTGSNAPDAADEELGLDADIADTRDTVEVVPIEAPPDDAGRRVADRTLQPGACTNVADEFALTGRKNRALRICASECLDRDEAQPPDCVSACLIAQEFTAPCADCYEQLDRCQRALCPTCADAAELDPRCACEDSTCAIEFDACAGVLSDLGPAHADTSPTVGECTSSDHRYVQSAAIHTEGQACSLECGDDLGCWEACLTAMHATCLPCVVDFDGCSALWCPEQCAEQPLSQACTDCASACIPELQRCMDLSYFSFGDEDDNSALLRVVLPLDTPPIVSLLGLPDGQPLLRLIRTAGVYPYTSVSSAVGVALTAGGIGPDAEVLASADTTITTDGFYTAVAWQVGSAPQLAVFEDDPTERALWRMFNASSLPSPALVALEPPHAQVFGPLAAGAMSAPAQEPSVPELLGLDADGDGTPEFSLARPIANNPRSENVTLWLYESVDGLRVLVTTSGGESGTFVPRDLE